MPLHVLALSSFVSLLMHIELLRYVMALSYYRVDGILDIYILMQMYLW
jgi:hypothetical protein